MININGFVEDIKSFGGLIFLTIRTLTTFNKIGSKVQFVVQDPQLIQLVKSLVRESYVNIEGEMEPIQRAKIPSYRTTNLNCLSNTLEIGGSSLAKPRSRPYLNFDSIEFRRKEYHQILLANDIVRSELRRVLHQLDFIEITTPKLISGFTEGGADLFKIDSVEPLYLSQSPQLHKQSAINMGISKVFELAPIYRAEKFKTPRHLNQAFCWDMEIATCNMDELLSIIKKCIIAISCKLNDRLPYVQKVIESDFKSVTYEQAIYKLSMKIGQSLTIEQERKLPGLFNCKYLFITHYPILQKPFYIKGNQNFDLVCAFGELASGGLRENDYSKLSAQLKERNMDITNLEWYVNMFKVGTPSSGGAGIGLERLISNFLNIHNVKYTKIF